MKKSYTKNDLKKMMLSENLQLSEKEVKTLIGEELQKSSDDVDTDYIDLCFELLEKSEEKAQINVKKSVKRLRPFAVAAAIIVIFAVTVSAIHFNIPEAIARLVGKDVFFKYNLENADTSADGYALDNSELFKKCKDAGITPVTFPERFTQEDCKITSFEKRVAQGKTDLNISFDISGTLAEMQIQQGEDFDGDDTYSEINDAEMIKANGMDVLVFRLEESTVLVYKDGSVRYMIYMYCEYSDALRAAQGIK